jgi:small subunit ribosomal protein S18
MEERNQPRIIPNALLFNKKGNVRSRNRCPIDNEKIVVDYKNIVQLKKFTSEKGKIMPRRITGISAANQRKLKNAVKRARDLALLPFSS